MTNVTRIFKKTQILCFAQLWADSDKIMNLAQCSKSLGSTALHYES